MLPSAWRCTRWKRRVRIETSTRSRHPRSRARAFVWYLIDGPLVTFYRPTRRGRRQPIEILDRCHLPWTEWPHASEWSERGGPSKLAYKTLCQVWTPP